MNIIVKINLISFYYLIEIIKLRKTNVLYKMDINKMNANISQYNKLLNKHKEYFDNYKDIEADTFRAELKIEDTQFNTDSIYDLSKRLNIKYETLLKLNTKDLLKVIKWSIMEEYKKSLEKETDKIVKSDKIIIPKA